MHKFLYNMSVFTLTYFVAAYLRVCPICRRYAHKDEEEKIDRHKESESVKEKERENGWW